MPAKPIAPAPESPVTTEDEAREILRRALARSPRLTHFGMGLYGENAMTVDVRARTLALSRAAFAAGISSVPDRAFDIISEIRWCADWVKIQRPTAKWNWCSSYGLKHVVQRWCGAYVANGSLIAAALGLGHEIREDEGRPNVAFKFGELMIKATVRAPRTPSR